MFSRNELVRNDEKFLIHLPGLGKELVASATPLFFSSDNIDLSKKQSLIKTFIPKPTSYFQSISSYFRDFIAYPKNIRNIINVINIKNIKDIKDILNTVNNDNHSTVYAILFHNSEDRLTDDVVKFMFALDKKNIPCYHFVVKDSIQKLLQKSSSQKTFNSIEATYDLLCDPIWRETQKKMREMFLRKKTSSFAIRIYPYLNDEKVMLVIKGLIFSHLRSHWQKIMKTLDDATFVPQIWQRCVQEYRYCVTCGLSSVNMRKFHIITFASQKRFQCDKCHSLSIAASSCTKKFVKYFLDCRNIDIIKKCFDLCYKQKEYKKALCLIEKLISHYNRDYKNKVIFMFMRSKIFKHMLLIKDAKNHLGECKKMLSNISTQEPEFYDYFGIVILYEGALLDLTGGNRNLAQKQFEEVLETCQKYSKISNQHRHIKLIKCYALNYLVYIYRQQPKGKKKALEILHKLESDVTSSGIKDIIVVKICQHIGVISCEQGKYKLALAKLHESKKILSKLSLCANLKNQILAEIFQSIGEIHLSNGEISKALKAMRFPLEHAKKTQDQNFCAICWKTHGKILQQMGKHKQSIDILKKSLDICVKREFGVVDEVLKLLGINFRKLGKNKTAIKCFQKALKIAENNKNTFRAADLSISISEILIEENKFEQARKYLLSSKKTGKAFENKLLSGKNFEFLGISYLEEARQSNLNSNKEEKDACLKKSLDNFMKAQKCYTNPIDKILLSLNLGKTYAMLEQYDTAEASYKEIINMLIRYYLNWGLSPDTLIIQIQWLFYECINFYYMRVEALERQINEPSPNKSLISGNLKRYRLLCVRTMEFAKYLEKIILEKQHFDRCKLMDQFKQCEVGFPAHITSVHHFMCKEKKILFIALTICGNVVQIKRKKKVRIDLIERFINQQPTNSMDDKKRLGNMLFGGLDLPKKFTIFPARLCSSINFAELFVGDRCLKSDYEIGISLPLIEINRCELRKYMYKPDTTIITQ